MQLDKHPILWQGYNVVQQIEKCGSSLELTRAVVMAGALNDEVEKIVDQLAALSLAVKPFVEIVKTTDGRIPTDRLSAADWDRLCKAFELSGIIGKLDNGS